MNWVPPTYIPTLYFDKIHGKEKLYSSLYWHNCHIHNLITNSTQPYLNKLQLGWTRSFILYYHPPSPPKYSSFIQLDHQKFYSLISPCLVSVFTIYYLVLSWSGINDETFLQSQLRFVLGKKIVCPFFGSRFHAIILISGPFPKEK